MIWPLITVIHGPNNIKSAGAQIASKLSYNNFCVPREHDAGSGHICNFDVVAQSAQIVVPCDVLWAIHLSKRVYISPAKHGAKPHELYIWAALRSYSPSLVSVLAVKTGHFTMFAAHLTRVFKTSWSVNGCAADSCFAFPQACGSKLAPRRSRRGSVSLSLLSTHPP